MDLMIIVKGWIYSLKCIHTPTLKRGLRLQRMGRLMLNLSMPAAKESSPSLRGGSEGVCIKNQTNLFQIHNYLLRNKQLYKP